MKPGTRLGPYEVLEQLGAGGMGEVWLARDDRLGREVAVKILPPELALEPSRLARFEREARAAGALNHPNIGTVHDARPPPVPNTRGRTRLSICGDAALASKMAYITPSGIPPHTRMTTTNTPINTP